MAIRFGGPHSPGTSAAPAPPPARLARRTRWITAAGIPFLIGALFSSPAGMALGFAAFGALAAGMWLTREGLAAEAAWAARPVARRPALPRKLLGGIATGAALALGAFEPGTLGLAGPAFVGLAGLVLHALTFGGDPWRDKLPAGADGFQQDRARRMAEDAEAALSRMAVAIQPLRDAALGHELAGFTASARRLIAQLEAAPSALPEARRYLGLYLTGARDATERFAQLYAGSRDPNLRAAWRALIADLTTSFAERSGRLLAGDRASVELDIEVLRERLAREGVRVPEPPRIEAQPEGIPFDALLRDTAKAPRR